MAKKNKNKGNQIFAKDAAAQTVLLSSDVSQDTAPQQTLAESADSFLQMDRLTPENKTKLDTFDKISLENEALNNKVSELTEQLAKSLEKIDKLNEALIHTSESTPSQEDEILNQKIENLQAEASELRKQIQELRAENDACLVRISDLSFENTRLRSQVPLQQTAPQPSTTPPPIQCGHDHNGNRQQHLAAPKSAVNVKYVRAMNGYSDWN